MDRNVSDQSSLISKLSQPHFYLPLIFLLALGVRGCAVVTRPETPIADAADYHQLAIRLAEGPGYVNSAGAETAWRPPGYPAFLSIVYRAFGPSVRIATFIQVFVGALTVILLMLLTSMLFGWRESILAGLIAAAYPGLVWLPRLLLSENLSLLLTVAMLCAVTLYLKSPRIWWLALFGFLGGLNTLVRGGNLLLPIIIGAALVLVSMRKRSGQWRRLSLGLLMAAFAFVLVLMPWTIRNYRVFHRFVPVATQEGLTLYASYWPPKKDGKLIWGTLPGPEDTAVAAAAQAGDEVSASKYLQQVTISRLREQPSYFIRLIPSKLISLVVPLDWEILPHAEGETRSINFGYLLLILPASTGFLIVLRNPRPHRWLLWILPAMVLVQAVIFYGSPRFRLPAELIAILLATVGLSRAYAFLKSRKSLLGLKLNLFG